MQVFTPNGESVVAFGTTVASVGWGKFAKPWGMCVDGSGRILVGDGNHRVQVFAFFPAASVHDA